MDLDTYQILAMKTAVFPQHMGVLYCTLALNGEAGEVAEKVKKVIRDSESQFTPDKCKAIANELGDVLWYLANLADQVGYTLEEVAQFNLNKLYSRQVREKLQGSGDNR